MHDTKTSTVNMQHNIKAHAVCKKKKHVNVPMQKIIKNYLLINGATVRSVCLKILWLIGKNILYASCNEFFKVGYTLSSTNSK